MLPKICITGSVCFKLFLKNEFYFNLIHHPQEMNQEGQKKSLLLNHSIKSLQEEKKEIRKLYAVRISNIQEITHGHEIITMLDYPDTISALYITEAMNMCFVCFSTEEEASKYYEKMYRMPFHNLILDVKLMDSS